MAERFAREGYVGLTPNMFYKYPDQAALETLKNDVPQVGLSRVAVMGVCQTGCYSLIAAAESPIHSVYGEVCHTQPVPDVREFCNCLERNKITFKIIVARDAPHEFLNDTIPNRFCKTEANAAWASQMASITISARTATTNWL